MNHQFDNIQLLNKPLSDARVADEGQERMDVLNRKMNSNDSFSKGFEEPKGDIEKFETSLSTVMSEEAFARLVGNVYSSDSSFNSAKQLQFEDEESTRYFL
jgi:hypothetical protein